MCLVDFVDPEMEGKEVRVGVVCGRGEVGMGEDEDGEEESWIVSINAAMANLPLARVMNCGMHIWRLDVAMRHAQNVAITSPADTFPSLTSLEPNQNPWTNIPIMTNCASALVTPQTLFNRLAATRSVSNAALARVSSNNWALNALTVGMAESARSMREAVVVVCARSWKRRGDAMDWEKA